MDYLTAARQGLFDEDGKSDSFYKERIDFLSGYDEETRKGFQEELDYNKSLGDDYLSLRKDSQSKLPYIRERAKRQLGHFETFLDSGRTSEDYDKYNASLKEVSAFVEKQNVAHKELQKAWADIKSDLRPRSTRAPLSETEQKIISQSAEARASIAKQREQFKQNSFKQFVEAFKGGKFNILLGREEGDTSEASEEDIKAYYNRFQEADRVGDEVFHLPKDAAGFVTNKITGRVAMNQKFFTYGREFAEEKVEEAVKNGQVPASQVDQIMSDYDFMSGKVKEGYLDMAVNGNSHERARDEGRLLNKSGLFGETARSIGNWTLDMLSAASLTSELDVKLAGGASYDEIRENWGGMDEYYERGFELISEQQGAAAATWAKSGKKIHQGYMDIIMGIGNRLGGEKFGYMPDQLLRQEYDARAERSVLEDMSGGSDFVAEVIGVAPSLAFSLGGGSILARAGARLGSGIAATAGRTSAGKFIATKANNLALRNAFTKGFSNFAGKRFGNVAGSAVAGGIESASKTYASMANEKIYDENGKFVRYKYDEGQRRDGANRAFFSTAGVTWLYGGTGSQAIFRRGLSASALKAKIVNDPRWLIRTKQIAMPIFGGLREMGMEALEEFSDEFLQGVMQLYADDELTSENIGLAFEHAIHAGAVGFWAGGVGAPHGAARSFRKVNDTYSKAWAERRGSRRLDEARYTEGMDAGLDKLSGDPMTELSDEAARESIHGRLEEQRQEVMKAAQLEDKTITDPTDRTALEVDSDRARMRQKADQAILAKATKDLQSHDDWTDTEVGETNLSREAEAALSPETAKAARKVRHATANLADSTSAMLSAKEALGKHDTKVYEAKVQAKNDAKAKKKGKPVKSVTADPVSTSTATPAEPSTTDRTTSSDRSIDNTKAKAAAKVGKRLKEREQSDGHPIKLRSSDPKTSKVDKKIYDGNEGTKNLGGHLRDLNNLVVPRGDRGGLSDPNSTPMNHGEAIESLNAARVELAKASDSGALSADYVANVAQRLDQTEDLIADIYEHGGATVKGFMNSDSKVAFDEFIKNVDKTNKKGTKVQKVDFSKPLVPKKTAEPKPPKEESSEESSSDESKVTEQKENLKKGDVVYLPAYKSENRGKWTIIKKNKEKNQDGETTYVVNADGRSMNAVPVSRIESIISQSNQSTDSNNATGDEVAPEISKMRPDTKETIKELRDRGMEGAAKGHESLDSAEAGLPPKLAKKVGREGEVAERATEIFQEMDTKGMTEDELHQARHQAWAEAIAEENNPDLNDVMAAHEEIAAGFASYVAPKPTIDRGVLRTEETKAPLVSDYEAGKAPVKVVTPDGEYVKNGDEYLFLPPLPKTPAKVSEGAPEGSKTPLESKPQKKLTLAEKRKAAQEKSDMEFEVENRMAPILLAVKHGMSVDQAVATMHTSSYSLEGAVNKSFNARNALAFVRAYSAELGKADGKYSTQFTFKGKTVDLTKLDAKTLLNLYKAKLDSLKDTVEDTPIEKDSELHSIIGFLTYQQSLADIDLNSHELKDIDLHRDIRRVFEAKGTEGFNRVKKAAKIIRDLEKRNTAIDTLKRKQELLKKKKYNLKNLSDKVAEEKAELEREVKELKRYTRKEQGVAALINLFASDLNGVRVSQSKSGADASMNHSVEEDAEGNPKPVRTINFTNNLFTRIHKGKKLSKKQELDNAYEALRVLEHELLHTATFDALLSDPNKAQALEDLGRKVALSPQLLTYVKEYSSNPKRLQSYFNGVVKFDKDGNVVAEDLSNLSKAKSTKKANRARQMGFELLGYEVMALLAQEVRTGSHVARKFSEMNELAAAHKGIIAPVLSAMRKSYRGLLEKSPFTKEGAIDGSEHTYVEDGGLEAPLARSEQDVSASLARHADLETKHEAGTITEAELKEAQKLVDEVAELAGYSATLGRKVYHGSNSELEGDAFKLHMPKSKYSVSLGEAIHFTTKREMARFYGKNVKSFYLKANLISSNPAGQSLSKFFNKRTGRFIENDTLGENVIAGETPDAATKKALLANGYTGIEVSWGDSIEYTVFESSQAKSADPFTGVPLSERFDTANPSILHAPETTGSELTQEGKQAISDAFAANMERNLLTDLDEDIVKSLKRIDDVMTNKFGWVPVLADHIGVNMKDGTVAGVSILGTFDRRANNPLEAPSKEFLLGLPNQTEDTVAVIQKHSDDAAALYRKGDKSDPAFLEISRVMNRLLLKLHNDFDRFFEKGDKGRYQPTLEGAGLISEFNATERKMKTLVNSGEEMKSQREAAKTFKKLMSKQKAKASAAFKKMFGKDIAKGSDFIAATSDGESTYSSRELDGAIQLIKDSNQFVVKTIKGKRSMHMPLVSYHPQTHQFELNYKLDYLPHTNDGKRLKNANGSEIGTAEEIQEAVRVLNETNHVKKTYDEWKNAERVIDDAATILHADIESFLDNDEFVEDAFELFRHDGGKDKAYRIALLTAKQNTKKSKGIEGGSTELNEDTPKPISTEDLSDKLTTEQKRDYIKVVIGDSANMNGSFFGGKTPDQAAEFVEKLPSFEGGIKFSDAHAAYDVAVKEALSLEALLGGFDSSDPNYDPKQDVKHMDFTNVYNPYSSSNNEVTRTIGYITPLMRAKAAHEALLGKNLKSGVITFKPSLGHVNMAERALSLINSPEGESYGEFEVEASKLQTLIDKTKSENYRGSYSIGPDVHNTYFNRVFDSVTTDDLIGFIDLFKSNGVYNGEANSFVVKGEAFDLESNDFSSPEWSAFRATYINPVKGKLQADMQAIYDNPYMGYEGKMHLERGDVLYLLLDAESPNSRRGDKRSDATMLLNLAESSPLGKRENADLSDIARRLPLPVSSNHSIVSRAEFDPKYIDEMEALYEDIEVRFAKHYENDNDNDSHYKNLFSEIPFMSVRDEIITLGENLKNHIKKYGIKPSHFNKAGLPVDKDGKATQGHDSVMEAEFLASDLSDGVTFDLATVIKGYQSRISEYDSAIERINRATNIATAPLMSYDTPLNLFDKVDSFGTDRRVLTGGIESAVEYVAEMIKIKDPNPNYNIGETKGGRLYNKVDEGADIDPNDLWAEPTAIRGAELEANQKEKLIHYMYKFLELEGDATFNLYRVADILSKKTIVSKGETEVVDVFDEDGNVVKKGRKTLKRALYTKSPVIYNTKTMIDADQDHLIDSLHEVMLGMLAKERSYQNVRHMAAVAYMSGSSDIFGAEGTSRYGGENGTKRDEESVNRRSEVVRGLERHYNNLKRSLLHDENRSSQVEESIESVLSGFYSRSDITGIGNYSHSYALIHRLLLRKGFHADGDVVKFITDSKTPSDQDVIYAIRKSGTIAESQINSIKDLVLAGQQSFSGKTRIGSEMAHLREAIDLFEDIPTGERNIVGRHLDRKKGSKQGLTTDKDVARAKLMKKHNMVDPYEGSIGPFPEGLTTDQEVKDTQLTKTEDRTTLGKTIEATITSGATKDEAVARRAIAVGRKKLVQLKKDHAAKMKLGFNQLSETEIKDLIRDGKEVPPQGYRDSEQAKEIDDYIKYLEGSKKEKIQGKFDADEEFLNNKAGGKPSIVAAKPDVDEFNDLMTHLMSLPAGKVSLARAEDVLNSIIRRHRTGSSQGLVALGNLLNKGLDGVPVILHDGRDAPDHLKDKNLSGVILDDQGAILGIYLNSHAEAGFAGHDSGGIQSVIHDLIELRIKENLNLVSQEVKDDINKVKEELDLAFTKKARKSYIDNAMEVFEDILRKKGEVVTKKGKAFEKKGKDSTSRVYYFKSDDTLSDKSINLLNKAKIKRHEGREVVEETTNWMGMHDSSIIKRGYTVDLTYKNGYDTLALRAEIGKMFDAGSEFNANNLAKMIGFTVATPEFKSASRNARKKVTVPKSAFFRSNDISLADRKLLHKELNVSYRRNRSIEDISGYIITGDENHSVRAVYELNDDQVFLEGSDTFSIDTLKEAPWMKLILAKDYPNKNSDNIKISGNSLVKGFRTITSRKQSELKEILKNDAMRYERDNFAGVADVPLNYETAYHFRNMSDVEFFTKIVFDSELQIYLDRNPNLTSVTDVTDFLNKNNSDEVIKASEEIVSNLSYLKEVALFDALNTEYAKTIDDVDQRGAGASYKQNMTSELNEGTHQDDVKNDLDGGSIEKGETPTEILSELIESLGENNSSLQGLIQAGLNLMISGSPLVAPEFYIGDGVKPFKDNPLSSPDNHFSPASITLADIVSGRADEIVQLDRMKKGLFGAYLDALDESGNESNKAFFDILLKNKGGEFPNKLSFAKGDYVFEDMNDAFSDDPVFISLKPKHGTITDQDYKIADQMVSSEKKIKGYDGASQLFLSNKIRDLLGARNRLKSMYNTAADELEQGLLEEDYSNSPDSYSDETPSDTDDPWADFDSPFAQSRDTFSDELVLKAELDDLANKLGDVEAQITILKAKQIKEDQVDRYEGLRDVYALRIWEERIRRIRKRRRNAKVDLNNDPDVLEERFIEGNPFYNYLLDTKSKFDRDAKEVSGKLSGAFSKDAPREGYFLKALEDVFTGKVILDNNGFVFKPNMDIDGSIKSIRRREIEASFKYDGLDDTVDDKGRDSARYYEHVKREPFVLHAPDSSGDTGERSSLLVEFGMKTDHELSEELAGRSLIGLQDNNSNFAALDNESSVRTSIEAMINLISDFAVAVTADFSGATVNVATDVEFEKAIAILSLAEEGDLHGFMKDAQHFAGHSLGKHFMSHARAGKKFYSTKLHSKHLNHQDASVEAFLGSDRPMYELMIGMIGSLDQGLGNNGGRNKAHVLLKGYEEKMTKAIKNSSHTDANYAYTASLLTRHVPLQTVKTKDAEGEDVVVDLTVEQQFRASIDHVRAGLDYSEVKTKKEKRALEKWNDRVGELADKGEAFLDSYTGFDLAADYRAHMMSDVTEEAELAIAEMSGILYDLDADAKALGEALGSTKDSYKNLQQDVIGYVPHLVVGSSLGETNFHQDRPMYANMAGSVGKLFPSVKNATALNFSLMSVAMAEISKRVSLSTTAVEYSVIDSMFGYTTNVDNMRTTGLETGAHSITGSSDLRSVSRSLSLFGRDLFAEQKKNDMAPKYVRGRIMSLMAKDSVLGHARSLTSILQIGLQVGSGYLGAVFRSPKGFLQLNKALAKLATNKEYRDQVKKIQGVGAAYLIDRGFNGIEEFERSFADYNSKDYNTFGKAWHYTGFAVNGIVGVPFRLLVNLPDAWILNATYAMNIEKHVGNVSEVAKDPTGYTKELALARVETELVMAQSDLSKKAGVFQPKESDMADFIRLLFIPFGNQKMTMGSNNGAMLKTLFSSNVTEGVRKEALLGLGSNLGNMIGYHATKSHAMLFQGSMFLAFFSELFDDDEDEKDLSYWEHHAKWQKEIITRLSGKGTFFGGEDGNENDWLDFKMPTQLQIFHESDVPYTGKEYISKMLHSLFLESSSLIHPLLSLTPATNTLGVIEQSGSDYIAENHAEGTFLEPFVKEKGYGSTFNPRGKRYTHWEKDGKRDVQVRDNIATAIGKNFFAEMGSLHGFLPDLLSLEYTRAAATRDYKVDSKTYHAYASQLVGTRDARNNLRKDLLMRQHGKYYMNRDDKRLGNVLSKVLSGETKSGWHNSEERAPENFGTPLSSFKGVPDFVSDSNKLVFGRGGDYHQDNMLYKYNATADGDSFHLTKRTSLVWDYTAYRIIGVDTFEKTYSNKYGEAAYDKAYQETGLSRHEMLALGKEAAWHVDQLFNQKRITLYRPKSGLKIGDRQGAFAQVEVDGKKMDLGIYLASRGLSMLRDGGENGGGTSHIESILPSGMKKQDYIRAYREAEAFANKNRLGRFNLATHEDRMRRLRELRRLRSKHTPF